MSTSSTLSSQPDLIHLTSGLTKIREIVERQKASAAYRRRKLRDVDLNQIRETNGYKRGDKHGGDENEINVFYDFPLRLRFNSENLLTSEKYNDNDDRRRRRDFNDFNTRTKLSRMWKSDEQIQTTDTESELQYNFNHDKIKWSRKVATVSAFERVNGTNNEDEEEERLPRWETPRGLFADDNFLFKDVETNRNRRKTRGSSVDANRRNDVRFDVKVRVFEPKIMTRSLSNLPMNKLNQLINKSAAEKKRLEEAQEAQIKKVKERHYDVKQVRDYMKRKREEAKNGKDENIKRTPDKTKSYNVEQIREFIKKRRSEMKRKELEKSRGSNESKCERSYDVDAVREYMQKKQRLKSSQENEKPLIGKQTKKTFIASPSQQRNSISPVKVGTTHVNTTSNTTKVKSVIDTTASSAPLKQNEKQFSQRQRENVNSVTKNINSADNLSNANVENNKGKKADEVTDVSDAEKLSPTRRGKGHRRTDAIASANELRDILTGSINEKTSEDRPQAPLIDSVSGTQLNVSSSTVRPKASQDQQKSKALAQKNDTKEKLSNNSKLPHLESQTLFTIKQKANEAKPDDDDVSVPSGSAPSSLSISVDEDEELSPITMSPCSSLMSGPLHLNGDISMEEKEDSLLDKQKHESFNSTNDERDNIRDSVKKIIERADDDISWDNIYARVFEQSLTKRGAIGKKSPIDSSLKLPESSRLRISGSSTASFNAIAPPGSVSPFERSLSAKMAKATEVFPGYVRMKSPNDTSLSLPLPSSPIQTQPMQPVSSFDFTPPVLVKHKEEDKDATDSANSFVSFSSSSSTSTPSTTKSVTPTLKQSTSAYLAASPPLSISSTPSPPTPLSRSPSPKLVASTSPKPTNGEDNQSSINSYSSNFESLSASSGSISLDSSVKMSLSVSERLNQIRKEHNLTSSDDMSNASLSVQKASTSKLSQLDLLKLTSDLNFEDGVQDDEEVPEDDATDNVSSIKSEDGQIVVADFANNDTEASISSTLELETEEIDESIADIDINEVIKIIGEAIFQAKKSNSDLRSITSMFTRKEPYKLFLFDLCKEIVYNEFELTDDIIPMKTLPKLTQINLRKQRWPSSASELSQLLYRKVTVMIEKPKVRPNIERDGLMKFWRKSRKRDLVDNILYEELVLEDRLWTNFSEEEKLIKAKLAEVIDDDSVIKALKTKE